MRKSSSFAERIVGLSALDHGPEHGDASPCEGDERLGVVFVLTPLAVGPPSVGCADISPSRGETGARGIARALLPPLWE